jgi:hypothetical protein
MNPGRKNCEGHLNEDDTEKLYWQFSAGIFWAILLWSFEEIGLVKKPRDEDNKPPRYLSQKWHI